MRDLLFLYPVIALLHFVSSFSFYLNFMNLLLISSVVLSPTFKWSSAYGKTGENGKENWHRWIRNILFTNKQQDPYVFLPLYIEAYFCQ